MWWVVGIFWFGLFLIVKFDDVNRGGLGIVMCNECVFFWVRLMLGCVFLWFGWFGVWVGVFVWNWSFEGWELVFVLFVGWYFGCVFWSWFFVVVWLGVVFG